MARTLSDRRCSRPIRRAERQVRPGGVADGPIDLLQFGAVARILAAFCKRRAARLGCTLSAASLRKGGFCVSTRLPLLAPARWSKVGPIAADSADAADGIFRRFAYPDHSRSGAAFPTERNVDPHRLKTCLKPARARGFFVRPVLSPDCEICSMLIRKRSAALPVHELRSLMSSRTKAAIGSASIYLRPCVRRVGAAESARGPEYWLAHRRPERKIGHPRQAVELNRLQGSQAVRHRIK
jgi:hypothetical protein